MDEEEKTFIIEAPIYEKLAPNEILIISKEKNCVTYATNENGKLILRKACFTEDE